MTVPSRDQEQASELAAHWHETDGLADRIAAALADARADGDRLRERVEALADEWYAEAAYDKNMLRIHAADNLRARIRAALDADK